MAPWHHDNKVPWYHGTMVPGTRDQGLGDKGPGNWELFGGFLGGQGSEVGRRITTQSCGIAKDLQGFQWNPGSPQTPLSI